MARKIIDAHMHFFKEHIKEALVTMDRNDIEYVINLSMPQEEQAFMDMLRTSTEESGGRVATLSNYYYEGIDEPGFVENLVARFRREVEAGSKGLKVLKHLGLNAKDSKGNWIRVDDERLNPIWAAAGEMGVPVLIHTADPIPNWMPIDSDNPRREMFEKEKTYYFGDGKHFGRLDLLRQRDKVVGRHPKTVFVNAHWGCYPEDIDHLVELFETYPNFYADTEFGKIAMTPAGKKQTNHRDIMLNYADRMLLGTDLCYWPGKKVDHSWNKDMYNRLFARFESREDGGFDLPEDVLEMFYFTNARKIYDL